MLYVPTLLFQLPRPLAFLDSQIYSKPRSPTSTRNLLAGTIRVEHADHPARLAWRELRITGNRQVSESTRSSSHCALTRYHNCSPYNYGCCPTRLDSGSCPG